VAGPGDGERGTGDDGPSALAKASRYVGASTTLVVAVGVFSWLGIWLDRKFATSPWLTLLGAALGMTGGFISFFRTVLPKR
jgi:F0F1-type ATP synthase assembly protein I